jgi:hypothetical protein
MDILAIICIVCFSIGMIHNAVEFFKTGDRKNSNATMGWFCALTWCLMATLK